jgi:putative photosynthetic complex assembly protein
MTRSASPPPVDLMSQPTELSSRLVSSPRVEGWPLALIGLVMASSIAYAAWSQHQKTLHPPSPVVAVLESRELRFADARDGSVEVRDAASGALLPPIVGEAGFARSVLRGLAQARLKAGGRPAEPFVLRREADGSLRLADPVTGRVVDLTGFGPDNARVFQSLLQVRQQVSPGVDR